VAASVPPVDTNGTAPEKTRKLSLLARARRRLKAIVGGRPAATDDSAAIYPPSPYASWGFENATDAIAEAVDNQTIDTSIKGDQVPPAPGEIRFPPPRRTQDPILVNRAFYTGDHWQYGSGYIGPHPSQTDAAFNDAMVEIANIFTSQNAIREVTDRHAAGVVGRPFRWALVPRRATGDSKPTTDEQTAIDEASGLLRQWLTARKVPTLIGNATATLLLAERAAIRLVVPAGLAKVNADGTTTVAAKTIEQALAKVWPEHPTPEASAVACDDDTKLEAGVVTYEASEYDDATDKADTSEYAWICFLNQGGDTVIRILSDDDEPAATPEATDDEPGGVAVGESSIDTPRPGDAQLKLGGRLTMFEMHRPALITPQVQQSQRALNFAATMIPRNVTTGGFVERLLLDASVPGQYVVGPDNVKRFVPSPLKLGAGTTNFIEAAEYETTNPQGEKVVTRGKPTAVFRDPVKPDASITAKQEHYESILAECGQLHVLITGDAQASAVSRIQARAEYLNTLLKTKPEVEAALSWLIETALAMAEAIAQQPGKYTNVVRAQVSCKLDTGPITPEERKTIEASIGVTISQETAMLMLDIEDVDAEQSRMAEDPASRAEYAKDIGDALTKLTTAGATLKGAAKIVGLTPEQIADLMTPEDFAALPAGIRLNQPKPGDPGEVVEPQPALDDAAVPSPALEPAPNGEPQKGAKGAKPASTSGSAPGGASGGQSGTPA
jgi:hypothetical protein